MALALFLGLPISSQLEEHISQINSHFASLLTSGGDYLHKQEHEGQWYLGKPLATIPSKEAVCRMETHLLSLISKLAPDYSYTQREMRLLTLHNE